MGELLFFSSARNGTQGLGMLVKCSATELHLQSQNDVLRYKFQAQVLCHVYELVSSQ
jgi:hypothetical protein